ncbi:MAG: fimbrillin family protein [Prevotella sp.]|jgi:hypothetical protein|nr:fimbrillin family protein [Prevotella sp.]
MKKHILLYWLAFIALPGFNACNNEAIETLGDPAIEKGKITFALSNRTNKVTTYADIQTAAESEPGKLGIYYFDGEGVFKYLYTDGDSKLETSDNLYTVNVGDDTGAGQFMIVDVPEDKALPDVASLTELQNYSVTNEWKVEAPFYWAHQAADGGSVINIANLQNAGGAKTVTLKKRAVRIDLTGFADAEELNGTNVALNSVTITGQNTNFALGFGTIADDYADAGDKIVITKAELANTEIIDNGGTFYLLPTTLDEGKTQITLEVETLYGPTTATLNFFKEYELASNKRYKISATVSPKEPGKVQLEISYADWDEDGEIAIEYYVNAPAGFGNTGLDSAPENASYEEDTHTITYTSLASSAVFSIPCNDGNYEKTRNKHTYLENIAIETKGRTKRLIVTLSGNSTEIYDFTVTVDAIEYRFKSINNPYEYPDATIYEQAQSYAMYIGPVTNQGIIYTGPLNEGTPDIPEGVNRDAILELETEHWKFPTDHSVDINTVINCCKFGGWTGYDGWIGGKGIYLYIDGNVAGYSQNPETFISSSFIWNGIMLYTAPTEYSVVGL